jgi:hypothetical protein
VIEADRLAALESVLVEAPDLRFRGARISLPVRAPDQLGGRPLLHAQAFRVDLQDAELAVEEQEALAHVLQDSLAAVALGRERLLGLHLFGNIGVDAEPMGDQASVIT